MSYVYAKINQITKSIIMKKTLLFVAMMMTLSLVGKAQDFDHAVGLRLGYPLSVSYKKFLNEQNAIEAYVGYRSFAFVDWLSLSGAYQVHNDLNLEGVDGLQWYYGGGASLISVSGGGSSIILGLQGYLGLSYTFDSTPINLSIDWVPGFYFGDAGGGFGGDYGALAVRYVLGK